MQTQITVASLKSLSSNGYGAYVAKSMASGIPHFGEMPPLQDLVNENITDIYKKLDNA